MASAIKKQLKKKPVSQWEDVLHRLIGNASFPKARIETGVFQIGTNRYIDKLVFKCGDFQPDPALPYVFVMGKKLKKGPESYEDVRGCGYQRLSGCLSGCLVERFEAEI